jgi:hypothetical protein
MIPVEPVLLRNAYGTFAPYTRAMVSLSHGLRIGAFVLLLGLATSAGAGAEVVLIRPLTINVPGPLTISVATPPPRTVSVSSIAIAISTPAPAIVHVQPLSISVRDPLPGLTKPIILATPKGL